jgi:hypothetical protein
MNSIHRFASVFDEASRLWHFTAYTDPRGCIVDTACGRFASFQSEECLAFNIKDFSELEMHASNIFCLQCCTLGQLAFDQLRYDGRLMTNQLEKAQ